MYPPDVKFRVIQREMLNNSLLCTKKNICSLQMNVAGFVVMCGDVTFNIAGIQSPQNICS